MKLANVSQVQVKIFRNFDENALADDINHFILAKHVIGIEFKTDNSHEYYEQSHDLSQFSLITAIIYYGK